MRTITRLDNPDAITHDSASKTVTFKLKGDSQTYTLTYDFNNVVLAEEKTGLNLLQGLTGGGSATIMRGLLFAFLLKSHPVVLVEEAGDLFSKESGTVSQALGTLLAYFSFGLVTDAVPDESDLADMAESKDAAERAKTTATMNSKGQIPVANPDAVPGPTMN